MRAKEVEQLTGLSKQTLIWYEKEGLIHPARKENRYREYSAEDVELLRLIKMLRGMGISIDDISQMLENHLSIETLLDQQKTYLQKEQAQTAETEKCIRFYTDTRAPLLQALEEMYVPKKTWSGRERPLMPFHIGTRPDRRKIGRLLAWNMLWLFFILFLHVPFAYRFEKLWGRPMPLWILTGGSALCAAVLILFGFGLPQLGLANLLHRYTRYVEFSREGISYVKADSPAEKLRFLWQALHGREALVCVPYTQIKGVHIFHGTRYLSTFSSPFAYEFCVTSFTFHFEDETAYTLPDQLFYGNDEEIITKILQEKVGQVRITPAPAIH